MGHIICIASQKGGTGKTTTAINLATSLSIYERKTLLLDCDPQGSATTGMGIDKKNLKYSLLHALSGEVSPDDVIVRHGELDRLHIIPSHFSLYHAASRFRPRRLGREFNVGALKQLIDRLAGRYDYIILDSPPALGFLTISAMTASRWLLIPVQFRVYALEGLGQLLSVVKQVRKHANPDLKIAGIVFTHLHDDQDENSSGELNPLNADIISRHFTTSIPYDRMLNDASMMGKPAALCDIQSTGAVSYLKLAREIMTLP